MDETVGEAVGGAVVLVVEVVWVPWYEWHLVQPPLDPASSQFGLAYLLFRLRALG